MPPKRSSNDTSLCCECQTGFGSLATDQANNPPKAVLRVRRLLDLIYGMTAYCAVSPSTPRTKEAWAA